MSSAKEAEAELESFRRQWQEEVSARARQPRRAGLPAEVERSQGPTSPERQKRAAPLPKPLPNRLDPNDGADEIEPTVHHDLPDKEEELKLGAADGGLVRGAASREPSSALEHYEKAVEKEASGSLGDSLRLYRTAFKMDDNVQEKYKHKHFPPSSFPPKPPHSIPSKAPAIHSSTVSQPSHGLPVSISQLVEEFSQLSIPVADPPTDLSPPFPCPIAELPEEILIQIIEHAAITDVATMGRLSRVCKRFAFLVMTEEQVWKRLSLGFSGFAAMHYDYACDLKGNPIEHSDEEEGTGRRLGSNEEDELISESHVPAKPTVIEIATTLLDKEYSSSWRLMFKSRPRIRFNGCYISTVNYTRPGGASTTTTTWSTPVHIVTYFRYLRFFRDGSAISLLTTTEPVDVVHHLTKSNLHKDHSGGLPSAVMKDALRGRWRLSGPGDGIMSDEAEGYLHIETEGVVPKYMWKMQFALGNAGRGTRNNKLSWNGFWSYNRLTDDWGEFGLKNDKAYYWSRVKSYGNGI